MSKRTIVPIGPYHALQEEPEFFQLHGERETVVGGFEGTATPAPAHLVAEVGEHDAFAVEAFAVLAQPVVVEVVVEGVARVRALADEEMGSGDALGKRVEPARVARIGDALGAGIEDQAVWHRVGRMVRLEGASARWPQLELAPLGQILEADRERPVALFDGVPHGARQTVNPALDAGGAGDPQGVLALVLVERGEQQTASRDRLESLDHSGPPSAEASDARALGAGEPGP